MKAGKLHILKCKNLPKKKKLSKKQQVEYNKLLEMVRNGFEIIENAIINGVDKKGGRMAKKKKKGGGCSK
jgi:hypothetical protein